MSPTTPGEVAPGERDDRHARRRSAPRWQRALCRARMLPEPLQRLIGYAVHEPFLGWHDLQDPIELLRGY